MKVSWIVTDSNSAPQKVEPYISGVEFTAKPDYKYYAERLSQTASRITEVFGWEEKDIMMGSQQATLFDNAFDRPSAPKKKEEPPADTPPKSPPKAKNMKLSDFF
jgi:DNA polymerase I